MSREEKTENCHQWSSREVEGIDICVSRKIAQVKINLVRDLIGIELGSIIWISPSLKSGRFCSKMPSFNFEILGYSWSGPGYTSIASPSSKEPILDLDCRPSGERLVDNSLSPDLPTQPFLIGRLSKAVTTLVWAWMIHKLVQAESITSILETGRNKDENSRDDWKCLTSANNVNLWRVYISLRRKRSSSQLFEI